MAPAEADPQRCITDLQQNRVKSQQRRVKSQRSAGVRERHEVECERHEGARVSEKELSGSGWSQNRG